MILPNADRRSVYSRDVPVLEQVDQSSFLSLPIRSIHQSIKDQESRVSPLFDSQFINVKVPG